MKLKLSFFLLLGLHSAIQLIWILDESNKNNVQFFLHSAYFTI